MAGLASWFRTDAIDTVLPVSVTAPLARVRAATAARHARLDAALPVAQAGAGMAEYRTHLRLLRDWLVPMRAWEREFLDGPQDPRRLPRSERVRWLLDDLDELGEPAAPDRPGSAWPAGASTAWRWGVAYVVEGSQLGARVLLAHLQGRLGTHQPRFLAGGHESVGARWRIFLAAFGAALPETGAIEAACAGACHAFDEFARLAGLELEPMTA
jgi:heme oxygenase